MIVEYSIIFSYPPLGNVARVFLHIFSGGLTMMDYSQIGGARVRIFAESSLTDIEGAVAALAARDNIEYLLTTDQPVPELISYCDIVILKWLPDIDILIKDIKQIMRSEARLVLCIQAENECQLDKDVYGLLDDVWIYPFSQKRVELRLAIMVQAIMGLRESVMYQSWLETLMDLVPDMVWFKSSSGEHLKVNKAFIRAAGKTRRMIEGSHHSDIWGGEDEDCNASELEVLAAGQQRSFDEVLVINNTPHHLKTHKVPFKGANGAIVGTLGVAQDLTSMLNLDLELGIFVEAMPFPLLIVGEGGQITQVNNKFLEMFGERRDDLIGASYSSWSEWAFEDAPDFIGKIFRYIHSNPVLLIQFTETPLIDSFDQSVGMVLAFMDVTAEKKMEAQIRQAAHVDSLTGVANRHGLAKWLDTNRPNLRHIVYVDLDNFKSVNDTFGHEAGDNALCSIVHCIREVFPEDFLARMGGDEFVLCVCRNLEVAELAQLAEALQTRAADDFLRTEEFKKLSLSIGIRPWCEADISMEQLIREADSVMYKAKGSGKARVEIWSPN